MSGLPDDWGSFCSTCSDCGGRYHASGSETCNCPECPTCGMQGPADSMLPGGTCARCTPRCFYCEEEASTSTGPQQEPICKTCLECGEYFVIQSSTTLLLALICCADGLEGLLPKEIRNSAQGKRLHKELQRLDGLVDKTFKKAQADARKTE